MSPRDSISHLPRFLIPGICSSLSLGGTGTLLGVQFYIKRQKISPLMFAVNGLQNILHVCCRSAILSRSPPPIHIYLSIQKKLLRPCFLGGSGGGNDAGCVGRTMAPLSLLLSVEDDWLFHCVIRLILAGSSKTGFIVSEFLPVLLPA